MSRYRIHYTSRINRTGIEAIATKYLLGQISAGQETILFRSNSAETVLRKSSIPKLTIRPLTPKDNHSHYRRGEPKEIVTEIFVLLLKVEKYRLFDPSAGSILVHLAVSESMGFQPLADRLEV